jgi:hypothetical protein
MYFLKIKSENWRAEQVLPGQGLVPVEGGERMWEGEYIANTMYICV